MTAATLLTELTGAGAIVRLAGDDRGTRLLDAFKAAFPDAHPVEIHLNIHRRRQFDRLLRRARRTQSREATTLLRERWLERLHICAFDRDLDRPPVEAVAMGEIPPTDGRGRGTVHPGKREGGVNLASTPCV